MDFRKALARSGEQLNKASTCQEWSSDTAPRDCLRREDVRLGEAKLEKMPRTMRAAEAEQANQTSSVNILVRVHYKKR